MRISLYPRINDFIVKVLLGYSKDLGIKGVEVSTHSALAVKSISESQEYSGDASILAIGKMGDVIFSLLHYL